MKFSVKTQNFSITIIIVVFDDSEKVSFIVNKNKADL